MKRVLGLTGLLWLAAGCLCDRIEGSGQPGKDTRSVAPFEAVELSGAFRARVVVAAGTSPRVELEGDDNLLAHVRTATTGDLLVVDLDTWSLSPRLPLVVVVRAATLKAIEVNGANTVTAEGLVRDEFSVEANGSATITLKGQVGKLSLDLNGSAEVDALALTTRATSVDIAGSGHVAVCATDDLHIDISGSGDVAYACEPDRIEQEIDGSGRVTKK